MTDTKLEAHNWIEANIPPPHILPRHYYVDLETSLTALLTRVAEESYKTAAYARRDLWFAERDAEWKRVVREYADRLYELREPS